MNNSIIKSYETTIDTETGKLKIFHPFNVNYIISIPPLIWNNNINGQYWIIHDMIEDIYKNLYDKTIILETHNRVISVLSATITEETVVQTTLALAQVGGLSGLVSLAQKKNLLMMLIILYYHQI